MHPKNPRAYIEVDPNAVDPCEHEPGERFVVYCDTCGGEEMGEIEAFVEGVCWRCEGCGEAMDLSVTAPGRIVGNSQ